MNNFAFVDAAETRAAHLRELSHNLRSLEWTNASRREVEHEIPELELTMAVYRRLNSEGGSLEDGAKTFLNKADARAEHLRQVTHHMHSLEWVHASLTEVESEIPELELAMAVYRRLSGEAHETGTRSPAKSAAPAPPARPTAPFSPREEDQTEAEGEPAPSFSQFAMAHLDPSTETADQAAGSNGSA
ncbi:MAG: hypothetical protein JF886_10510 [Candidatus Dormibacteraeota bacterium]|uniref:Uncharacterized protein n=1 Tax=Candidatus Aeolococcus gillhamiae TaxID=3127015 RepID=A0A934JUL8_9BACT|nr:hypothetical protein [Candidatus Dormibacteraeota bacterium]